MIISPKRQVRVGVVTMLAVSLAPNLNFVVVAYVLFYFCRCESTRHGRPRLVSFLSFSIFCIMIQNCSNFAFSHYCVIFTETTGTQQQTFRQWQESIEKDKKSHASFIAVLRQVRISYLSTGINIERECKLTVGECFQRKRYRFNNCAALHFLRIDRGSNFTKANSKGINRNFDRG